MNALEFLKKDHQEAMSMMDQIMGNDQGTANDPSRMEVFNRLKEALTLHTRMEEEVFYPALREHEQTRGIIEHSYKEHDKVDNILSQMGGMPASNSDFMSMIEELKNNVQHHVHEEEHELFPKAEQVLGQQRLQEMGNQMMQMKQGMSASATMKRT